MTLKAMKTRTKRIVFPVFKDYEIIVVVTTDLKKAIKRYDSEYDIDEGAAATLLKDDSSIIFIPICTPLDIMVHESWHAVKNMMDHLELELDHETVAYHLGYVVDQIQRFVYS